MKLLPGTDIGDEFHADLLFSKAGLTDQETFMIQSSINNRREFDLIKEALIAQRPRKRLQERNDAKDGKYSDGKYKTGQQRGRFQRRKGVSVLGDDFENYPDECQSLYETCYAAQIRTGTHNYHKRTGKGKGKYRLKPSNLSVED